MTRYTSLVVLGTLVLVASGCGPKSEQPAPAAEPAAQHSTPAEHSSGQESMIGTTATAQLQPADPSSGVSGTVTFTQEMGGVHVVADVSGLTPGKHGFHIHENGECTPPFDSAGGHWNPYNLDHGCPPAFKRHVGDLGNIEVGPDGKGHFDQVIDKISVVDPHHLVVGRALIVHAGEDDCKTQPSGGSGARIACGVIQLTSKPGGDGSAPPQQPPTGQ